MGRRGRSKAAGDHQFAPVDLLHVIGDQTLTLEMGLYEQSPISYVAYSRSKV